MTRDHAILWVTLVLALAATIIPLPDWAALVRPEWAALVALYWALALPHRFSVASAWLLGLLLDVLRGVTFGQHALALVLITYLIQRYYLRLRNVTVWQQAVVVGVLLAVHESVLFWASGMTTDAEPHWQWPAVLLGALLWPPLFVLLRSLRRHYQLA